MDRDYYWAQPDVDAAGRWVIYMNPADPCVISEYIDKDTAEQTAKSMCESKRARENRQENDEVFPGFRGNNEA